MSAKPHDIFISYAEADRGWVEGYLLNALNEAGVDVLTQRDFRLGAYWTDEFERAVSSSDRALLVLSSAYLADINQHFVTRLGSYHAFTGNQPSVIPLLLEDIALRLGLQALVPLKAVTDAEREQAVKRLCDEVKVPLTEAGRIQCPYPGMRPFTEQESELFFGRSREVGDLIQKHLRLHPFVAVIGRSGTGKSSLVSAGLVPALAMSSFFGGDKWTMLSMRPSEKPLEALQALVGIGTDPTTSSAKLLSVRNAQRLLLIIDQFEEVFTLANSSGQRQGFQELLLTWIGVPNCYVVLTVRADFYPDLMTCKLWPQIQGHRDELLPLDRDGLRAAIEEPARSVGVFIEPTLVERLLNDAASEPGMLPLVQETMVLLWEKLQRRFLPVSAYQELGRNDHCGLQEAMSIRAERTLAELPDADHKIIARRIFLRLVQFGEGRPDTRRQRQRSQLRSRADDESAFDHVLNRLIKSRLLVAGELDPQVPAENQDPPIDIAHERLITGWPTFQGWLKEKRSAEQSRRRLEEKADEWIRLGGGAGGLLDEVELREVQNWLSDAGNSDLGTSDDLKRLVVASNMAINDRKAAEEVSRQERVRQAEALAEQQKTLAEEQRLRAAEQTAAAAKLKRRLIGVLGLAVAALILLVVVITLFYFEKEAEKEAVTQKEGAVSQSYANAAYALADRDPTLATQFAIKARDTDQTAALALAKAFNTGSWFYSRRFDNTLSADLSSDGRRLAMVVAGSGGGQILRILDLLTNQTVETAIAGDEVRFLRNGNLLTWKMWGGLDNTGKARSGVLDLLSGTGTMISHHALDFLRPYVSNSGQVIVPCSLNEKLVVQLIDPATGAMQTIRLPSEFERLDIETSSLSDNSAFALVQRFPPALVLVNAQRTPSIVPIAANYHLSAVATDDLHRRFALYLFGAVKGTNDAVGWINVDAGGNPVGKMSTVSLSRSGNFDGGGIIQFLTDSRLVAASTAGWTSIVDLKTGKALSLPSRERAADAIGVTKQGDLFIVGRRSGIATAYEPSGIMVGQLLGEQHSDALNAMFERIVFDDAGTMVLTVSRTGTRLWRRPAYQLTLPHTTQYQVATTVPASNADFFRSRWNGDKSALLEVPTHTAVGDALRIDDFGYLSLTVELNGRIDFLPMGLRKDDVDLVTTGPENEVVFGMDSEEAMRLFVVAPQVIRKVIQEEDQAGRLWRPDAGTIASWVGSVAN